MQATAMLIPTADPIRSCRALRQLHARSLTRFKRKKQALSFLPYQE